MNNSCGTWMSIPSGKLYQKTVFWAVYEEKQRERSNGLLSDFMQWFSI
jgi:hypothetical protein